MGSIILYNQNKSYHFFFKDRQLSFLLNVEYALRQSRKKKKLKLVGSTIFL